MLHCADVLDSDVSSFLHEHQANAFVFTLLLSNTVLGVFLKKLYKLFIINLLHIIYMYKKERLMEHCRTKQ